MPYYRISCTRNSCFQFIFSHCSTHQYTSVHISTHQYTSVHISTHQYPSVHNCWNHRKAKRHDNGLHIAHDPCHLFTGPTLKKQQHIILELTVRKQCTIRVDSSAHHGSEMPCLCSVIMSCCFSKVLTIDKRKHCIINLAARPLPKLKNT